MLTTRIQEFFRPWVVLFRPCSGPSSKLIKAYYAEDNEHFVLTFYPTTLKDEREGLIMIWVISPDSESRQLIGLNLSKRGYGVMVTSTVDELGASSAEPQLIVLDVDSPERSGWEIAKELRCRSGVERTPMILLVSDAPIDSQLIALQPVHWLEKPLDIDALLTLVCKIEEGPETAEEPNFKLS